MVSISSTISSLFFPWIQRFPLVARTGCQRPHWGLLVPSSCWKVFGWLGLSLLPRISGLGLANYSRHPMVYHTLPSVTVRNVSMTESFFSVLGASSMNPITTCTIFVVACLSCPCFLDNSRTCSLSRPQSPESLHIVTRPTSSRDVEARSDAFGFPCKLD